MFLLNLFEIQLVYFVFLVLIEPLITCFHMSGNTSCLAQSLTTLRQYKKKKERNSDILSDLTCIKTLYFSDSGAR
jgi:hypothetical protein